MTRIQKNIEQIRGTIEQLTKQHQRATDAVTLLAVSKTKPIEAILEAVQAGQVSFGENYVQEGVHKVNYFQQHHPDLSLDWHFIGPIQSNKTRLVAEHFDWVHTLDRVKIAQRLNDQRPSELKPLQVLIQVNISGEASKSGLHDEQDIVALAQAIDAMPQLNLRGLMSIPAHLDDYAQQLETFIRLKQLNEKLQAKYSSIDTLSMGMSGDMAAAIEAGSTIVRIGTAIFGARDYNT